VAPELPSFRKQFHGHFVGVLTGKPLSSNPADGPSVRTWAQKRYVLILGNRVSKIYDAQ